VEKQRALTDEVAMSDAKRAAYVAAFALGLGSGVTLERYRAPRGGLHKMRLVHHESGVSVEREYDGSEPVLAVQNELIGQLQAKLSDKGMSWIPARDQPAGTA
jgi:hypothetical protein